MTAMSLVPSERGFETTWFQRLCARVIRYGPIPRHVAFIMDGNRRFAAKKHVERIEGHSQGFNKLAETLKWCQDLGVEEVTVYAFSAENFNRSKEEVDSLMELARQKFARILEDKDKLEAHGVQIRVVGELHLLSPDLQKMAAKIQSSTKTHNKCRLNICAAYVSKAEMTSVVRDLAWGVQEGLLLPSDVTQELMTQALEVSTVDLLIRTSGEVRLSDFLLWQSSFSYLSFLKALWPEFSIWDFYGAILQYQKAHSNIEKTKHHAEKFSLNETHHFDSIHIPEVTEIANQRVKRFLEALKEKRNSLNEKMSQEI